jgi:hypothetical protein
MRTTRALGAVFATRSGDAATSLVGSGGERGGRQRRRRGRRRRRRGGRSVYPLLDDGGCGRQRTKRRERGRGEDARAHPRRAERDAGRVAEAATALTFAVASISCVGRDDVSGASVAAATTTTTTTTGRETTGARTPHAETPRHA